MNLRGRAFTFGKQPPVTKRTLPVIIALAIVSMTAQVGSAAPATKATASKEKTTTLIAEAAKKAAAKTKSPKTAKVAGLPKVYEFGAPWCVPCKKFAPTFEKLKLQYSGKAEFESVDVNDEKNKALADKYGVVSVPKIVVTDAAGKMKYEHEGIVDEKTLIDQVNKAAGQ